jgi:putative transposase
VKEKRRKKGSGFIILDKRQRSPNSDFMPRRIRCADAGYVYHVLNRAVGRTTLFGKPADYAAFEKILGQAWERTGMRLLSFVVMPNHWHLVVWPAQDGALSTYMQWLTTTHVRRWHAHQRSEGTGPLYQGRFKSFPVEADDHFLTVCRYVERNPLRANLVQRAEDWRWSSLWHRRWTTNVPWLSDWPLPVPKRWVDQVNSVETEAELAAVRNSLRRGAPHGDADWQEITAEALGLKSSLRLRGRPKKAGETAAENEA